MSVTVREQVVVSRAYADGKLSAVHAGPINIGPTTVKIPLLQAKSANISTIVVPYWDSSITSNEGQQHYNAENYKAWAKQLARDNGIIAKVQVIMASNCQSSLVPTFPNEDEEMTWRPRVSDRELERAYVTAEKFT